MAVDDLNGSIRNKIKETIRDVRESVDLKIREFRAVMDGKTPEQVERLRRTDSDNRTKPKAGG